MRFARLSTSYGLYYLKLEQQMYEHARDLEFEEAAHLRDRIRHIQVSNPGMAD